MKIHHLYFAQTLALNPEQAWAFFSSPYHLNDITPAFFHVEITSPVPDDIYAGLMISYRMKAVAGWPMAWLSEVCHCQRPQRFVYQQRVGPFNFWSHEVCITPCAEGIKLEDIVYYAMPWGWLGDWLDRLLIGPKLQQIFITRRDYLAQHWGVSAEGNHLP
ncbi:SRPBCC family protein [Methylomonas paludis]|uniref:SRPBCC family protein n=1 Tax=Methylomonas paludis TaxID=1173101 RepID=A0A975MQX0_9GAMM|nr:SRPBCC family protein [Methylomonas paludis]QWF72150.1 SRPBCC family protein [Methylomonas paludis]